MLRSFFGFVLRGSGLEGEGEGDGAASSREGLLLWHAGSNEVDKAALATNSAASAEGISSASLLTRACVVTVARVEAARRSLLRDEVDDDAFFVDLAAFIRLVFLRLTLTKWVRRPRPLLAHP